MGALASEIICMTSGAIRLERRIRPVDRFRIALMACGTGQVAPVIQRLERQAGMREVVRQPTGRVVADATVLLGVEVTLILAGRRNAVVARSARAQDLRMVDPDNGRPPYRAVAVLTDIGCLGMGCVLTRCIRAVVATEAIAGDIHVIEVGRYPADCRMAVVAIVAAGDMCRVFAGGNRAVVAGRAATDHLRMVDPVDGCENDVVVAVLAGVRGLNMSLVLANCPRAVMAAEAVVCDGGMVEGCRNPAVGGVAVIAGIAAGNVSRMLAGGNRAVVTG